MGFAHPLDLERHIDLVIPANPGNYLLLKLTYKSAGNALTTGKIGLLYICQMLPVRAHAM